MNNKFDARLKFNPRDISRDRGSYYFIYDWENELIYDASGVSRKNFLFGFSSLLVRKILERSDA